MVDSGSSGLPVPAADLPRLLSRELDSSRPRGLVVTSVNGGSGRDRLLMRVTAGADRQRWEITYEIPAADVVLLDAASFVLTVRANLEEWWDTGAADSPALHARRLP